MKTSFLERVGAAEIAGILRREISSGTLGYHERLPAERVLAASYGVARGTVREAFNQLADDGLVEIRPSSGTYVLVNTFNSANAVIDKYGTLRNHWWVERDKS